MKAFLILSTMAAAASAKVASSVLRALEVDGNADVFVRFADASSALEAATIESNKPLERQEVFEILSDATATGQKSIEAATAGFEVTPTWIVSGAFIKAADKALIEKLTLNRVIKSVEQVPDMELDPVLSKSTTDDITAPAASPNQWGIDTVGAPAIWKYTNGSGIVIGSIDTGARHTHLLLKDSWRADRGSSDPYNRTAVPEDLRPLGTHTIGTMEKSYVKLITKTNKVISEFYSGVYADWVSDSVNELFVYDSAAKTLQAASNGQCLDAYRDGDKFGLHTYACDATNGNQKWIIDAANHKIKHATHNNLCLDVDPTNPSNAAQVWECHNANTNQWIDAVKY
ncbi:hypothetical protein SPRG_22269 [Saprolegnia parasitica CBS 223.65]|uniref:subtilisin n=1 Tax=Saprolegnia parasitica (strain CBS 223.65) TaxID=695850 RepID=A0A067C7E7_SAPPC|nr:hypothetical protein SPRG_22269 [Saprolegnia parasitica CBS 223.65]KDO22697.1 hypothetical protein SPRG_22269 [Saprolegnia parasitica CBS 223.65]|eukprot:XP_012206634.1 hypothetical protein SPRG_22269 [Saprolegnia parasitica CBS 223.65]